MKKSTSINPCLLTFFLFIRQSFCLDLYYEACIPIACGDVHNISYPFFIPDLQRPECGYPGFELHCGNNGSLRLPMPGNDFIVREIDHRNQSLRLLNAAVPTNLTSGCLPPINNITLDPNRFQIDNNVLTSNIVLFSNCSDELPANLSRYRIGSCDLRPQLVMLGNDTNLGIGRELCGGGVVAPVEMDGGGGVVDGGNYGEVMGRGFTMRWLAEDCGVCERSGGRCGFNQTVFQFRCFCPDRPRRVSCKPHAGSRNYKLKILVSALSVGSVILSIAVILCFRRKLGWKKGTKNQANVENFLKNHEFLAPRRYSYSEVKKMANSFKVKLGQGGFGSVYKGMLSNGNLVAVKVLSESKGNGEEFINEVASVGKTSHVNIVTLLGFCSEGRQRALIYEFMPNGSLEKFQYGQASSSLSRRLGWEKLHQIAIGIAQGLEYLHTGCNTRILHFDIKPHNILLDQDFCPKISDFGLAKLLPEKKSRVSMSHIRGTPGYIAPEMFSRNFGEISHKSDIYSYGMMVLEMVGGRKNDATEVVDTSEIYFPHWIYKKVELHEGLELHEIMSDEDDEKARKMIIVGLWCIQTNPFNRPSISKVLDMLQGCLELLEIPPKPYLSCPSTSSFIHSSTTY